MSKIARIAAATVAAAFLAGALSAGVVSAKTASAHKTPPKSAAKAGKMVTLKDGLKYQDIIVGKGAAVKVGQTVSVNYVGKLTSGSVFDASSRHPGPPFSFPLGGGQVIKGWDEGVQGMRIGGQRKLIVPPALGYGPQGGGPIPPNSTLIFTVTVLGAH